jgi:hypothetical protein
MAILVMITTAIAASTLVPGGMRAMTTPGQPLPKAYLTVNLVCSALAALLGGVVTARLATTAPLPHGAALAAVMVVMGLASARQAGGQQPRWYQLVLTWAMPVLALLGAWVGGAIAGAP